MYTNSTKTIIILIHQYHSNTLGGVECAIMIHQDWLDLHARLKRIANCFKPADVYQPPHVEEIIKKRQSFVLFNERKSILSDVQVNYPCRNNLFYLMAEQLHTPNDQRPVVISPVNGPHAALFLAWCAEITIVRIVELYSSLIDSLYMNLILHPIIALSLYRPLTYPYGWYNRVDITVYSPVCSDGIV